MDFALQPRTPPGKRLIELTEIHIAKAISQQEGRATRRVARCAKSVPWPAQCARDVQRSFRTSWSMPRPVDTTD